MLEEARMTNGIGARTANSIQCISTKKLQRYHLLTYAASAKIRKKMEIANVNRLTPERELKREIADSSYNIL
jgi:hypothetical protein